MLSHPRLWSMGSLVLVFSVALPSSVNLAWGAAPDVELRQSTLARVQPVQPVQLAQLAYLAQLPPPFSIDQVEIGQISTSSTEAQVRQRLGNPERVEDEYWDCCGNIRTLSYAETEVKLIESDTPGVYTVFSLSTTDSGLITQNGIGIGSTLSDVSVAYGRWQTTWQDGDLLTVFYQVAEYATALQFQFQEGRIIQMGFSQELT